MTDKAVVAFVADMIWGGLWHSRGGNAAYHQSKPPCPEGIQQAAALAVALSEGGQIRFDSPACRALIEPFRHEVMQMPTMLPMSASEIHERLFA